MVGFYALQKSELASKLFARKEDFRTNPKSTLSPHSYVGHCDTEAIDNFGSVDLSPKRVHVCKKPNVYRAHEGLPSNKKLTR